MAAASDIHEVGEDLNDLVGQLRQEGVVEESGRFTLDLSRAAERIEGLENRPGLYLLKLIQAVVAAGGIEIRIRIGRQQVEVVAQGPELFTPSQVNRALQGPFQSLSVVEELLAWFLQLARPVAHLRLALPAATYDSQRGWLEEKCDPALVLNLHRSTSILNWLAGLAAATREHALLYERCAFAPIPIWLDGRRLNDPDRVDGWVDNRELKPPSFFQFVPFAFRASEILVERNHLRSGPPCFAASLPTMRTVRNLRVGEQNYAVAQTTIESNMRAGSRVEVVHLCQWLHDGNEWPVSVYTDVEKDTYPLARAHSLVLGEQIMAVPSQAVAPYLSKIPARLSFPYNQEPSWRNKNRGRNFERNLLLVDLRLCLPLGLEGPSRLLPIRYGVAMDPLAGSFGYPGLIAVAAADQLHTDLSQLRVVQDEALQALLDRIQQQAQEMVGDFWEAVGQRYPDWVVKHIRAGLDRSVN